MRESKNERAASSEQGAERENEEIVTEEEKERREKCEIYQASSPKSLRYLQHDTILIKC